MRVYFYDDEQEGHVMTSREPSEHDLAAINTPPRNIDFNAFTWAIDETVERGLFKWQGDALVLADTYDKDKAFDPF